MHGLVFLVPMAVLVASSDLDVFDISEKRQCDDAVLPLLSSSDRLMLNWKSAEVKALAHEADMILTGPQKERFGPEAFLEGNKKPMIPDENRWPVRIVHYQFDTPEPNRKMITEAMQLWSARTCIKFAESTGNVLNIFQGLGCYASLGYRSEGGMSMSLTDNCDLGVVVHLLGHVIGLVHQHTRPDRDRYVTPQYHNARMEDVLFYNYRDYDTCPYDYGSVMQFNVHGLSKSGEIVFLGFNITAYNANTTDEPDLMSGLKLSSALGGSWSRPSDSDIALVNHEYSCPVQTPCSSDEDARLTAHLPSCNQQIRADRQHFERILSFSSLLPSAGDGDRHQSTVRCVWELIVDEQINCSRAAVAITLSKWPSRQLRRAWFASGCRLFQVEVYDVEARMSYYHCARQFARGETKMFVSTGRLIYVFIKFNLVQWQDFASTTLEQGEVRFFETHDFECGGEIKNTCS